MEMMEAVGKGDVQQAVEYQARIFIDGIYRQSGEVNAEVREKFKTTAERAIELKTQMIADGQPLNPLMPPAVQRLSEIHTPTLIISGALDHPENLRAAKVMASEIAEAKLVTLQDCAHLPSLEKPAAFNAALLEFLEA
jgi:2-hydroxy-6-oxonona-2,4-dienedioate hydrolase